MYHNLCIHSSGRSPLTGLAPPHSGRSPSSHSATSPSWLSVSAQHPGPRLRLSLGRSPGPTGSPSLGSGPAARHAGRSVSPQARSPSCLLGQFLKQRGSGHAQSVRGQPFPGRAARLASYRSRWLALDGRLSYDKGAGAA